MLQEVYREVYDPDNETFVEFNTAQQHDYFNCFHKHGPARFSSLERQRLVLSIMTAEYSLNGAQIQGVDRY